MKKSTFLKTAFLLCALVVGSSAWAATATLTNAEIVAAGSATDSYQTWAVTGGGGKTWNAYAIKKAHSAATSSYHFLQIKKYASSTAYYIQIPVYGSKITSITMTVSSTSKAMDGGGNSATLYFSSSNSTSATGTGVASGTGASSVTIDCSSLNLNTGYITAGGAVRIWDIEVTYIPNPSEPEVDGSGNVTLTTTTNMAGWRTYNNNTSNKYTVDGTTKVYYASATADSKVTLTEIAGGVPANTVVVLHQTSGTSITLTKDDDATCVTPGSNLLSVTTGVTTDLSGGVYRLGYKSGSGKGVGFYKYTNASAPAGIIYVATVSPARDFLDIDFGDATAIEKVETVKKVAGEYYNLAGQRVAQPTKGLYIVNGKKVIIK